MKCVFLVIAYLFVAVHSMGDVLDELIRDSKTLCFVDRAKGEFLIVKNQLGKAGIEAVAALAYQQGPGRAMLTDHALLVVNSVAPTNFKVFHGRDGTIAIRTKEGRRVLFPITEARRRVLTGT